MKFINFDKIGLTSDEGIKTFLGKDRVARLESDERNMIYYNKNRIKSEFDETFTICLLNDHSDRGYPLLAIVYPSCNDDLDAVTDAEYRYVTNDGVCETVHRDSFKSKEEVEKFVSKFYGAYSSEEVCRMAHESVSEINEQ